MAREVLFKIRVDDSGLSKISKFEKKVKSLREETKKSGKAFSGLSKSILTATGSLAKFAGRGLIKSLSVTAGVIEDVVSNSIALEDAMAGVRKTAGLTAEEVGLLTRQVRDYSVEQTNGMISAEDLASALEIAGQQGIFAGKSFKQGSDDALAFAKVMAMAGDALGGLTVERAAEQLGLFHGTFSDVVPDIERAASVLNFFGDTTKRSEGFILSLAGALSQAASTAGISESSTLAFAAALGDIQQVASKSGTGFSNIIDKMKSDTRKFVEAFNLDATEFERLIRHDMEGAVVMLAESMNAMLNGPGGSVEFSRALSDLKLGGRGANNVMQGLAQNADKLAIYLKQGNEQWDLNTSLLNSAMNNADRVSQIWAAFKNIISNTAGVIGDMLLPVFKDVLKDINQIAIEFRAWLLETDFIKNRLGPALEGIGEKIKELVKQAVEFVKNIDWQNVGKQVKEIAKGIVATAKEIPGITEAMLKIIKAVQGVQKSVSEMKLGKLLEFAGRALKGIGQILSGQITEGIKTIAIALKDSVIESFKVIKNLVAGISKALFELLSGPIKTLGSALESIWEKLGGKMDDTRRAAKDAAESIEMINESQKEVLREGVTQSVWPDLKRAIEDTNRSLSHYLINMQEVVYTSQLINKAQFQNRNIQRPIHTEPSIQKLSPVKASASNSGGTTINFNGMNVIDESSQQRFVREITRVQRGLSSTVIRAA